MKIFGKTDIGLVRSSNQDNFRVGKFDSGTVWAVLCDGMGGASGGDVASKMATDLIAERIIGNYNDNMKTSSVSNLFESAINFASIKIFDLARENEALFGMGTTVVVAIVRDGEVMISHVGDSRAYIISDEIRQVTKDHSVVQEMLDRGEISEDVAKNHPIKNYISRALGVKDRVTVDFTSEDFSDGDILLLCSDGLSNMIESDVLNQKVRIADDEICNKLIDMANENGGKDNITVVIASY